MSELNQDTTPLFDAVKKYVDDMVVQFHVPGHKQGKGIEELKDYVGDKVLRMDANAMKELDYLNNPTGAILESEKLFADAFNADKAYFLVNGTTSGVQAMIMSSCNPGDEVIIPRNAHKSAIGGIILSGAIPVYVQPEISSRLAIPMGVTVDNIKKVIEEHPHAKAVFIINPTYYGAASDIKSIVEIAHKKGMAVIVDEAHGAHMGFNKDFPITAMEAGADMSAASIHKTAGSMTQSSILLLKSTIISSDRVGQILNLLYTSSASYVLMCSLDIARKQLATKGCAMLDRALELARWTRNEINKINGLYAFGKELIGTPGCYDFDETKIGVNLKDIGLTGYYVESVLRKDYNIQIELSDLYNILGIISIGDTKKSVQIIVDALANIASKANNKDALGTIIIPNNPKVVVSPRNAFYSPKKVVKLEDAVGEISGEMIMAYPPGIPIVCPGEQLSKDIIKYITILKNQNCQIQGSSDPYTNYIKVLDIK
ncbi:arginine decarboxylase [Clostridium polyendosporum]|uniref:Arginine decarboxylase n=1 Tax=Clostridium polyendosporum TaxID=69208 RepID=A0A919RXK5_9CLOT|nr:arginine decarboxylase [Clostridium polyendosporum]